MPTPTQTRAPLPRVPIQKGCLSLPFLYLMTVLMLCGLLVIAAGPALLDTGAAGRGQLRIKAPTSLEKGVERLETFYGFGWFRTPPQRPIYGGVLLLQLLFCSLGALLAKLARTMTKTDKAQAKPLQFGGEGRIRARAAVQGEEEAS